LGGDSLSGIELPVVLGIPMKVKEGLPRMLKFWRRPWLFSFNIEKQFEV
jgi:hypothetical protein